MANKHLSPNPQSLSNEDAWYFEKKGGIEFLHQIRDARRNYLRTDHIMIPWWMIRKSLGRKDRP
jgi:hypothetical protein